MWFRPLQSKILATPINWRLPEIFFEDLFFGKHLQLCPWSLALTSSIPVLGLKRVCPWPWPRIFFCVLGLGFESCVHDSTSDQYFKNNNFFYKHQFGFRENLPTEIALHHIYEDFITGIETKQVTCSAFLDLKKAFDTVDHDILIAELQRYGIRELPLELIRSYLSNIHQHTVIHNTQSNLKPLTKGVRQGSILGPLLFLMYINDLPSACTLRIKLFANDANLTFSGTSTALLEQKINKELMKVDDWMKANKLSLIIKKQNIWLLTS